MQRLLINRLMKCAFSLLAAVCLPFAQGWAQGESPAPAPEAASRTPAGEPAAAPVTTHESASLPAPQPTTRSMWNRVLHPFSSGSKADAPPKYKDAKLRGLTLTMQISPQPVKLSEVRQLDIRATLTNKGKKEIEMTFGSDQRIEIYLMNSAEVVLTKWSDNHAVADKPGTVLINPQEHIEYNEKISTRELTRDKVFVAEVFFPQYPEIRVRQKFLTAP